MITVRPGSHVHRLLQLISIAGEIPTSALAILGSERVLAALVHKLESVQDIRFHKDGSVYRAKLIQVSGKKGMRTVRLYKKALPVLDELYPGLLELYMAKFNGHCFSGNPLHIGRNHRVAEALAACLMADVETRPYILPTLQRTRISLVVPYSPCFYIARDLKNIGNEASKTMYSRIVGALFYPDGIYAVYNTRDAVMKWSGLGEVKAQYNLLELARMNAGINDVTTALLFGQSPDVALKTIVESDKNRRAELRFDRIYNSIHFVPLDSNGVRLLKILILPDRNEKLLNALFNKSQRSFNLGSIEYDAIVNDRVILSHLDSDIARLIRFREALNYRAEPADILCFPWQSRFLRAYLGEGVGIRELSMDAVETALGT